MVNVKAVNINKKFGKLEALKNITFEIKDKEIFVIIGPSGSGKSTLLRIIAGLEFPDDGKVLFDDTDVTAIPANKRGIGMVFQDYAVWPHMSVEDNVKFVIKNKENADEIVKKSLDMVGLLNKRKNMPNQLSGGELQRVAIARALAVNPKILLLDEPLSNLDEKIRKELLIELIDIIKENKLTALFVTHSQEEAFEIGDRIAVLNKGQLEQIGTASELIESPKTPFVATFIGENLVFKAKLLKSINPSSFTLDIENIGEITVATKNTLESPSENLIYVYRINNLEVTKERTPDSFEANVISKKVIGNNVKYYLETPTGLRFSISIQGSNSNNFSDSSKVYVRFLPNKGYIFNS
ncbi:MAG: ABC transporter ATP-binding protein [Nitrososphaeria archaeon]|nr:ABC transporter ATP-binding protein [Conexivisphaerales archaeon]